MEKITIKAFDEDGNEIAKVQTNSRAVLPWNWATESLLEKICDQLGIDTKTPSKRKKAALEREDWTAEGEG